MKDLPALDEDACFFSQHCNCVEFILEEEKWKELEKLVLDFQKKIPKHGVQQEEKGGKSFMRVEYSTATHVIAKDKRRLIASLSSLDDREIRVADVNKLINSQEKFFNILSGINIKDLAGTSCTIFAFDTNSYAPVGGLIIPTKIELTKEILEKIGEVQISGFVLNFKNSPIGVTAINIEMENGLLTIKTIIEYKLSSIEKLPEKSFNMAKEVASFFVVRKQ